MGSNPAFPKFIQTEKQKEATKILASPAKFISLHGGSRSGKTLKIVRTLVIRASKVKSKHIIFRHTFASIKRSIWLGTLPFVMKKCFPELPYIPKNSDFYIVLPNGSEIWICGLDNSARIEKILGTEYSSLAFEEASQIAYKSVTTAMTRLSEKNELAKKVYFTCNPPNKKHFIYRMFIKHENPETGEKLDPNNYRSLLMNPADNVENLDDSYIPDILGQLPSKERARFEFGEFLDDSSGLVYYAFEREKHVKEFEKPKEYFETIGGMDFNISPMSACIGYEKNNIIYIFDEVFLLNSNTEEMCEALNNKNYNGMSIVPDSTGNARKTSSTYQGITRTDHFILKEKGFFVKRFRNPHIKDRINNVNRLLEQNRIIIHPRCKNLIKDLEQASWKEGKLELDKDPSHLLNQIADTLGYLSWHLFPLKFKENNFEIQLG